MTYPNLNDELINVIIFNQYTSRECRYLLIIIIMYYKLMGRGGVLECIFQT